MIDKIKELIRRERFLNPSRLGEANRKRREHNYNMYNFIDRLEAIIREEEKKKEKGNLFPDI